MGKEVTRLRDHIPRLKTFSYKLQHLAGILLESRLQVIYRLVQKFLYASHLSTRCEHQSYGSSNFDGGETLALDLSAIPDGSWDRPLPKCWISGSVRCIDSHPPSTYIYTCTIFMTLFNGSSSMHFFLVTLPCLYLSFSDPFLLQLSNFLAVCIWAFCAFFVTSGSCRACLLNTLCFS